jgi:hypothetical protein
MKILKVKPNKLHSLEYFLRIYREYGWRLAVRLWRVQTGFKKERKQRRKLLKKLAQYENQ